MRNLMHCDTHYSGNIYIYLERASERGLFSRLLHKQKTSASTAQRWCSTLDLSIYAKCKDNNVAVGIVSSLEEKYLNLSATILKTWGSEFTMIKIFVPQKVDELSIYYTELLDILVDAFDKVNISDISLSTSPGFEGMSTTWKIAQHVFLEAAGYLVESYPEAAWYILVDADTMIYKKCLLNFLSYIDPYKGSLVVGSIVHGSDMHDALGIPLQHNIAGEKAAIMGGSGTIWSNKAASKTNFSYCIEQTLAQGLWQKMNSDWRVTRCFDHFGVPIIPIFGMYQFRESSPMYKESSEPKCQKDKQGFAPPCVISKHYMTVHDMVAEYETYKQISI